MSVLSLTASICDCLAQEETGAVNAATPNSVLKLTSDGKNYEPMWSPDGKRIVFESTRSGNLEVYVMKADGADQTRLTNDNGNDASPSWSPDGNEILFFSDRDSKVNQARSWKLYRMKIDGSDQRRVTEYDLSEFRPVLSPNGAQIAFDAWSENSGTHQIFALNSGADGLKRLTNTKAYEAAPQWSPNGSRIVFYSERDYLHIKDEEKRPAEIYLMNADGSNQTRLTFMRARSHYPFWSPDGKHIAFETDVTGDLEVFVMKSDGSELKNVTNHPARDTSGSWSPVGKKLAFVSDRDGKPDIYIIK